MFSSGAADAGGMERLRRYVIATGVQVETATLDDLWRVLCRPPRSALGPGGIAYMGIGCSLTRLCHALHKAYLAILGGASPLAGFNDGILVRIP